MYNRITLIGTIVDHPEEMYDMNGNRHVYLSLNIPPPPDAPPTYWGGIYDLHNPDRSAGDDTFPVICRDPLLIERCLNVLHKNDLICVEGRLVLTLLRSERDLVPLAEILASDVILLKEAGKD